MARIERRCHRRGSPNPDRNQRDEDLQTFLPRRIAVSDAFLTGDPGPLGEVSVGQDPASIFGPSGTAVTGVEQVTGANTAGSASFIGYGRNDFETQASGSDGDLAYWVGVQRSMVRVEGRDEPVGFDLRLTELFRREDGEWRLFHRHADQLREG